MSEQVLVDNDLALKVCCYDCANEVASLLFSPTPARILGAAPFVIGDLISKSSRILDRPRAERALAAFLQQAVTLEPDAAEIALAANLEEIARDLRVDLDGGETLLFAILTTRRARALLTGDKRAIAAIEQVAEAADLLGAAEGRVGCLEQLMATLLDTGNGVEIAAKVCADPSIDKAIAICFRCASKSFELSAALEGLRSYVADLRAGAPRVLVPGDDLRTLVANENRVG